ncbi:MAG TPA: type IV toxin-antitoxin system AbiEi family antitoxin [Candidatus Paceibacterota bacterium]|nr:type IV toxin-antitoxin system AbiEi family antitoxin [Candidatus Paceibacterota bacterium]
MLPDSPKQDSTLARAGGWLRSFRSANPPPAPRRSGASAVRAAVRRASGNDYAIVPLVAPSSRTDRFLIFTGFYPFAQRSVRRYATQTMKTPTRTQETRLIGAAEAFIEARIALGRVAFSLKELTKESGLSAIAAKFQLLRLRGKVVRVSPRQPFFLIVGPEHRSMGAPPATWWLQAYFDWLSRPYYLALQSAASSYGSNPQALQVTQVMTDRPCRPIKVGRIQVRFFVKRGIERTPTQQLAQAAAPLCISTPEATAFDLVRYATSIGGIERAAETIRPLLPSLRERELKRVLAAENEPAVAQRLGFIVQAARAMKLAQVIYEWLPEKLTVVLLSPSKGERKNLPLVERWQVLNNSRELAL